MSGRTSNPGKALAALCTAALVLTSAPVAASTLTDLEGVRASSADTTIRSRGYYSHHTSPGSGGLFTYWWNNASKSCVRTLITDGVVSTTKTVSSADCGYYGDTSSYSNSSSGNNGAAAAAIAAAAIIGVVALAHKSHHRDDQEFQNPNDYAEFERGHRDGLYNHSYDNSSRSDSYAQGYQSGVNERSAQSSYRPEYRDGWNNNQDRAQNRGQTWNQQNSSYSGAGTNSVNFSDLVGGRSAGVETELQSRGFRNVGSEPSDNSRITIWWNGRTRQCLQVITADGRADSITDIQTHPRCR